VLALEPVWVLALEPVWVLALEPAWVLALEPVWVLALEPVWQQPVRPETWLKAGSSAVESLGELRVAEVATAAWVAVWAAIPSAKPALRVSLPLVFQPLSGLVVARELATATHAR
jgi:hypothetical protein